MTNPEPAPLPQTVVEWQAQLLRRIQHLAGEHTRVLGAGYEKFDGADSDADPQTAWQAHLEFLDVQREQAEQAALLAGVEAAWIDDARELGSRGTRVPQRAPARQNPSRDNAAQEFYIDMLGLDLWHLERMAGLSAACEDRIATGRWSFGTDPIAARRFAQNMALCYERVTALAHAAQITATEADVLWGVDAEGVRRLHAVTVATYDELTLVNEWNSYAIASPDLAVPPYIPTDPATGTPVAGGEVTAPTPQQMIAAAAACLRAEFVDAAVSREGEFDLVADPAAITEAVDAALPDGDATWAEELDYSHLSGGTHAPTDLGADP
jgi:hypothetical protein